MYKYKINLKELVKMKWDDEKVAILRDSYAYSNLNELADRLGTTKKAVIRKAQKLQLYRAKNNQIVDGYKFCSLCHVEHSVDHFYRNRAKYDGLEYYCKKYYELKNKSKATPPLSEVRVNATENGAFTTDKRANVTEMQPIDPIKNRPRNPTLVLNGVEGKVCNMCKTFKPLIDYSKDKGGIAGRKATCKSCYKERYAKRRG